MLSRDSPSSLGRKGQGDGGFGLEISANWSRPYDRSFAVTVGDRCVQLICFEFLKCFTAAVFPSD